MASLGAVLMFAPKVREFRDLQTRDADKQREIDETDAEYNKYRDNNRRFPADRDFVEKVAHEEGFARPNETIVQFSEAMGER